MLSGTLAFKAFSSTSLADGQPLSSSPIFRRTGVSLEFSSRLLMLPLSEPCHMALLGWGLGLLAFQALWQEERKRRRGRGRRVQRVDGPTYRILPHRPASWSSLDIIRAGQGMGQIKGKRNLGIKGY